jgi:hypothetical protein
VLSFFGRALGREATFAMAMAACLAGCGEEGLFPTTIDPGADFSVADIVFDESYFYCQVEPRVIIANSCGAGDPGQGDAGGGCHHSVTSFRLTDYSPPVADSCNGNVPTGAVPAAARQNYQTAQARMKRDPELARLLQHPLRNMRHPRKIFDESSDSAEAIREWATRVSTQ